LGWLDRVVTIIGLGLPLALLCTAVAFFLTTSSGQALFWTPAGFLIAAAAIILGGFLLPDRSKLSAFLQAATGVLMLVLPLLRLFMGGPGWNVALSEGQPIIVAVYIALLLAGGWVIARIASQRSDRSADQTILFQAAE
jgi:hypothetical protein